MRRRVGHIAALVSMYGVIAASRIVWAVLSRRPVPVPGWGLVLPYDGSVVYHLLNSPEKMLRLADYVEDGDLVFDVGAHAGMFAVAAARRGGRVVAVEPDPDVAKVLRANTAPFDVEVVRAALTDVVGPVVLWRVAESTQTSSLLRDAAEVFGRAEAIDVPTVIFDELVDRYGMPDVVKLDIQGLESRLVPGIPLEKVRVLLVEVSSLDDNPHLADDLAVRFGVAPVVVNEVHEGFDLAFTKGR